MCPRSLTGFWNELVSNSRKDRLPNASSFAAAADVHAGTEQESTEITEAVFSFPSGSKRIESGTCYPRVPPGITNDLTGAVTVEAQAGLGSELCDVEGKAAMWILKY